MLAPSPGRRRRLVAALGTISLLGPGLAAVPAGGPASAAERPRRVDLCLVVLHNNDGESELLGDDVRGGVARFAGVVDRLRRAAKPGPLPARARCAGERVTADARRALLTVSSGDNFLAGPEFSASLEPGTPYYDAVAMSLIGYDAIALGNHDFDFGPDVLAGFIRDVVPPVPFLSANLGFAQEPDLQELVDEGRIAASTLVRRGGHKIGIVGATTPQLRSISSPRDVTVDPDVAGAVQREVDGLRAAGAGVVILISHLQSVEEDLALAPQLRGVDVMVAGGGDELLANEGDRLLPGDEESVFGPYPLTATDADGRSVPVVTTSGGYGYVGRLVAGFDRRGELVAIGGRSGPVRVVAGQEPDTAAPHARIQRWVVEPVQDSVAALQEEVVARTEVALDGTRANVRTTETNEGDLIADALLWQARALAPSFGVPEPQVALQNGGGIRNDSIIGPGDITRFDTFDMLPFANFVSVVPDVSPDVFKQLLENAVSRVEFVDGRFAQVAGFSFTWDPTGTPQVIDEQGNVTTPGSRIIEVTLSDGTPIVRDGAVVAGAPSLDVATIDFLARGGDQYPFGGAAFTTLGVTYQQTLLAYLTDPGGLGGVVTASDYPEGGAGRISALP